MNKKASKSKGRTASWLTSIILHILILAVLLISTNPEIRNKISDAPVKIINNYNASNLLEEVKSEELTGIQVNPVNISQQPIALAASPEIFLPEALTVKSKSTSSDKIVVRTSKGYQSSFFGTSGEGERICYLVDISGSMVMAIEYIKKELINSISRLEPDQYFQIVFFAGEQPIVFSRSKLTRASYFDRQEAIDFIKKIDIQSVPPGIESWRPVAAALRSGFESQSKDFQYANLFYLFTDGDFDINITKSILDNLQQRKSTPAVINILQCGSHKNDLFLKNLSNKYKGQYNYLTDEDLVRLPAESNLPGYSRKYLN